MKMPLNPLKTLLEKLKDDVEKVIEVFFFFFFFFFTFYVGRCAEIARVGESKRIYQIEYIAEEQLLVVICGKQHHVRLVPVRALDGDDVEWLKVADTKACTSFTTGLLRPVHGTQAAVYCLCVAVKRQVHPSSASVLQNCANR